MLVAAFFVIAFVLVAFGGLTLFGLDLLFKTKSQANSRAADSQIDSWRIPLRLRL